MAASESSARISGWRQFKAILHKDIVMELRTKEMLTSMGLYALLVLVVYYIALSQAGQNFQVRQIAAGLLWLVFIFTSLLGLNRSLVHEKDQGCLDALLISPIDRPVIFFGKAVGNLIFLVIVEVFIVPLFYFIFLGGQSQAETGGPIWMITLALLVGSLGIAGVGTLLATMSVNTNGKDFILAVLFIPIMFPLLLTVVAATSAVLLADPGYATVFWKMMAAASGYDAIMLLAAYGLYEFVLGA
ncbi:MAG: heme ABC transporter permease CcmB [Actinobacteria bacterium HGW-Actinobacteria-7]|nr:MAG: heme ABC transporter permease CcmB [Actinobacteria bacterium HGW-Actinobacteria-7]